ncbi:hypothetical protein [Geodermatophilus sp. DSM 45219]|uniref:hypothetical protein n=1 Tax=Geodermatophilus sp. DSM 45219 TaxID=1881103 RepID=UPI00088A364D|nr:hypothetical protein [Geodermatophilus sp. DSM 45219]SDN69139.1 hypothetical protein SAMN05428965_1168 [Geodermatophilus sp. DSM 45219]
MSTTLIRRIGSAAAVLVTFLALMPAAQAGPAGGEPATVDTELVGTQAALVRINVIADVTIAHVNHSTGDVVIHQGTYEVPQAEATGVLVTGDGVVATLYRLLREDLDTVTVPAANRLFVEQIGAQLVDGNDATGPTHATDPAIDEHLQHCYRRVEHCIVVPHERYEVVLLSADQEEPVPATLVNQPSGPTDVALLRIGAGGLPTASLSPTQEPVDDAAVAGLDWEVSQSAPTTRTLRPAVEPVRLDGSRLTGGQTLTSSLAGGLNGGPVIDRATGAVLALADCDPSFVVSAVGAASIQAALVGAGVTATRSGFDIAFADGLAQINRGEYAAAAERLRTATTYFDSALARDYLTFAQDRAAAREDAVDDLVPDDGGIAWWMWGVVVLLVLGALTAGLLIGRRRRPTGVVGTAGPTGGAAPTAGDASAGQRDADR